MAKRGWPLGVLVLLGLLFFWPLVLQPTAVLYSPYSDFINYHIPVKHFLVRSWQQDGELPLWCPGQFSGMPFIHDPQVAAFYPPHAVLYWLPVEHLGAACSWLIVLHVIIAGLCMFAYARHRGLETIPALLAALGFMFAGKWLLHVLVGGHFNSAPLAWLPLVLLCLEQAVARGSIADATLAGGVFALIVLGVHPQLTLYAGLFAAFWSLEFTLEQAPDWRGALPHLCRWLGLGSWTAVVAVLLSAVQLLPTLAASRESSRALGMSFSWEPLILGLQCLTGVFGPPLTDEVGWLWENRLGLSIVWLALAVAAPCLLPERRLRLQAGFVLFWCCFGLGGMVLLQGLPGFQLFRLPSRLLLFLALPLALLAGLTVQGLLSEGVPEGFRARCRTLFLRVVGMALVLTGVSAWLLHGAGQQLQIGVYWLFLPVTLVWAWWLIGRAGSEAWLPWAWGGVLLADLWLVVAPLVQVYPEAELFAPSECVRYLSAQADRHGRVLDLDPINLDDKTDRTPSCATPLWPNFALLANVEPVRGYNPLDVLRYKEFLQFIMNQDEPLQSAHGLASPGPGGIPLLNENLADLLGIRFILLPRASPLNWYVSAFAAKFNGWRPVSEDPSPRAYSFVPFGKQKGVVALPPYVVYERNATLPRAFVVLEAASLPERSQLLETLRTTDFRQRVLLENWEPSAPGATAPGTTTATARLTDYRPNRITLEVATPAAGWLVLADVWYPGWTCTVDDQPVPIYRANYLFRAVEMPAGEHRVRFQFSPGSYRTGQWLSLSALTATASILLASWLRRRGTKPASN